MTRKRGDQIVFEQRLTDVIGRIVYCEPSEKIAKDIAEEWNISIGQAYHYIGTARCRIDSLTESKRKTLIGEMLARHDRMRRENLSGETRDHDLVLNLDKEDAKLLGLYAPERHEVGINVHELDDAIESDLAELAAARQKRLSGEPEV